MMTPVGSGKTALTLALCRALRDVVPMGVVTNDIFTQEDGEFLVRNEALPPERIIPVETGGCPHAAIREDVSANLGALETITRRILRPVGGGSAGAADGGGDDVVSPPAPLLLCESGGDNLAANFSSELADYTIYVIDVAGGDKVPRKGGPGITQSDLPDCVRVGEERGGFGPDHRPRDEGVREGELFGGLCEIGELHSSVRVIHER